MISHPTDAGVKVVMNNLEYDTFHAFLELVTEIGERTSHPSALQLLMAMDTCITEATLDKKDV